MEKIKSFIEKFINENYEKGCNLDAYLNLILDKLDNPDYAKEIGIPFDDFLSYYRGIPEKEKMKIIQK